MSIISKKRAILSAVTVVVIFVVLAGFAGSTVGSNNTVQSGSTDYLTSSSNQISSANITYTTLPDESGGTYTATVRFTNNIKQRGTPNEVMNAFSIGNDSASLEYNADKPGSNLGVDKANDTITFSVRENGGINSSTNFSKSTNDGLQYNGSAGNDPIYTDGDPLGDFNATLSNDIVPIIDYQANPEGDFAQLSAPDSENNISKINIFYSEDVTISSTNPSNAFGLTGDDAPNITDVKLTFPSNNFSLGTTLVLQDDIEAGDDLGKVTYDGSDAIVSASSKIPVQNSSKSDINLTVVNSVDAPPKIQRVVFDDVPENNDENTTGEMLLYFDSNVNVQKDDGSNTGGLSFDSDTNSVGINVDGQITDNYNEQPENVIAVEFSARSGAVADLVREGDTFGSNATLSVNTSKGIDITYNDTGRDIASTNVQAENISNEIAGNLSEVNSTSSDIEILGADTDEQEGSYNVTVSGLSDGENQVLNKEISVNISGASEEIPASDVAEEFRFDDEYNVNVSLPFNESVDSNIGETVPINVTNESGTQLRPNTAATVEIVNEARVTTAPTSNTFIVSLPQPGDIVADSDIGAITSYNATSGEIENYAEMDATDRVHRGIFIDGNGTGNVYGFAYETEASQVGGTTAAMAEGWNLVGSNTALNDTFPATYDEDLRFDTSPAVSSDDVRLFSTNDVGTNNVGTTIQTTVDSNESGVKKYDAYYVYMHEPNDRVIIEPGTD